MEEITKNLSNIDFKEDYNKALEYIKTSQSSYNSKLYDDCDVLHSDVLYHLGILYLYGGNGISQNHKKAFNIFTRITGQYYPNALYYLGLLCENGLGIKQDNVLALMYYNKAAEQNDQDAKYKIKRLESLLN